MGFHFSKSGKVSSNFFSVFSYLHPLHLDYTNVRPFGLVPEVSCTPSPSFSLSFSPVYFRLGDFYCSIFKFILFFLCHLQSSAEFVL